MIWTPIEYTRNNTLYKAKAWPFRFVVSEEFYTGANNRWSARIDWHRHDDDEGTFLDSNDIPLLFDTPEDARKWCTDRVLEITTSLITTLTEEPT